MARVICTLPNASTMISGIAFSEDRGQMVSEDISDAQAARLASIPGYILVGTAPTAADPVPAAAPASIGPAPIEVPKKRGRPPKLANTPTGEGDETEDEGESTDNADVPAKEDVTDAPAA